MAIVADLSGNVGVIDPHLDHNPNALRGVPGTTQILAIGAAAANSTVFDATAGIIELSSSGAYHLAIGPSATATANDQFVAAGVVLYRDVSFGDRVSIIQDGASTGNVTITRMDKR